MERRQQTSQRIEPGHKDLDVSYWASLPPFAWSRIGSACMAWSACPIAHLVASILHGRDNAPEIELLDQQTNRNLRVTLGSSFARSWTLPLGRFGPKEAQGVRLARLS
jgi:hypothetical protein